MTAARWFGVGRSETGHVRQTNQDAFAAINSRFVWVVADGMGGHPAGDLAARTAVDAITEQSRVPPGTVADKQSSGEAMVAGLITAANEAIHDKIQADPKLKGMGTTIVTMTIRSRPSPTAYVGHLGDSRAYRYHEGTLTQLTRDHTMVERFIQRGLITPEEAKTHPDRHVLIKGLGMGRGLKPDVSATPIVEGDLLLLCSDGLTKMLEDAEIAAILARAKNNPRRTCHDLIERALAKGGEDNVTAIVCAHTVPTKSGSLAIDKTPTAM